jgi:hypothetical protein
MYTLDKTFYILYAYYDDINPLKISAVTLHTTFCLQRAFVYFVRLSEQTSIISQYSINWLVSIAEKECVHSAVRPGSWIVIQVNLRVEKIKWR